MHETQYRVALMECGNRYAEMAKPGSDLAIFIDEFHQRITDYPLLKLNRWLGYIQGVLIERGITTVEAERDWTRPLFRPLDFS